MAGKENGEPAFFLNCLEKGGVETVSGQRLSKKPTLEIRGGTEYSKAKEEH